MEMRQPDRLVGTTGRIWPATGCDDSGNDCVVGGCLGGKWYVFLRHFGWVRSPSSISDGKAAGQSGATVSCSHVGIDPTVAKNLTHRQLAEFTIHPTYETFDSEPVWLGSALIVS